MQHVPSGPKADRQIKYVRVGCERAFLIYILHVTLGQGKLPGQGFRFGQWREYVWSLYVPLPPMEPAGRLIMIVGDSTFDLSCCMIYYDQATPINFFSFFAITRKVHTRTHKLTTSQAHVCANVDNMVWSLVGEVESCTYNSTILPTVWFPPTPLVNP